MLSKNRVYEDKYLKTSSLLLLGSTVFLHQDHHIKEMF